MTMARYIIICRMLVLLLFLKSLSFFKNIKGAFIFYKDNGEAVAYVLDENEQDLNGKLRSLCLQILRISFSEKCSFHF